MEQITDAGIILMVLISDLLIIIGVAVTLLISRSLSDREPDRSERIVRSAYRVSTTIAIVFGVLAETIIVLTVLSVVGFI
ncbi:hypothetical protein ACFL6S_05600 [Candidatus Poribacteria bacterium]